MSSVETRDGRTLALHEAGDPAGKPVIWHHGTPGSGLIYDAWADGARDLGIRLIGYDRSGYGGSTRDPGRKVAACVADVEAIADGLGLERFATWGISGGGPHALACAALCGERLVAAASLASVAPYGADGLDWLAGMGEPNLEEFAAVLEGEASLRTFLENDAAGMAGAKPEDLVELFATLVGPADRAVLTGEVAAYLLEDIEVGLAPGIDGWLDDDFAFLHPWGFDLATISRPVLVVHGADDRFVPISHGHWLGAHVPGAELRLTGDEDGHLTLIARRVHEVHEWLSDRF